MKVQLYAVLAQLLFKNFFDSNAAQEIPLETQLRLYLLTFSEIWHMYPIDTNIFLLFINCFSTQFCLSESSSYSFSYKLLFLSNRKPNTKGCYVCIFVRIVFSVNTKIQTHYSVKSKSEEQYAERVMWATKCLTVQQGDHVNCFVWKEHRLCLSSSEKQ